MSAIGATCATATGGGSISRPTNCGAGAMALSKSALTPSTPWNAREATYQRQRVDALEARVAALEGA